MDTQSFPDNSVGLGLRRCFIGDVVAHPPSQVDFYEVAPENWIGIGGKLGKQFRALTEKYRFVCHGLSLSLGSCDPLDEGFVKAVKQFMDTHGIDLYSEHLSYCSHGGHLYDLLPLPFSGEAVRHVAGRIKRVQDIIGRRIAIENISYYASVPGAEMGELEFFNAVATEADCLVLLDINNIYVNSVNHAYDPLAFLQGIPIERLVYAHVAGHYVEAEDFIVDTHGADIVDPVWRLLGEAYQRYGAFPTLLERDFNIPPLPLLLQEVDGIRAMQQGRPAQLERRHA